MRMQVEMAMVDYRLNIRHRKFAIPTCIDMNNEGAKTPVSNLDCKIRTIDSPAQPENAVVLVFPAG
jgi:hypothetical protein